MRQRRGTWERGKVLLSMNTIQFYSFSSSLLDRIANIAAYCLNIDRFFMHRGTFSSVWMINHFPILIRSNEKILAWFAWTRTTKSNIVFVLVLTNVLKQVRLLLMVMHLFLKYPQEMFVVIIHRCPIHLRMFILIRLTHENHVHSLHQLHQWWKRTY